MNAKADGLILADPSRDYREQKELSNGALTVYITLGYSNYLSTYEMNKVDKKMGADSSKESAPSSLLLEYRIYMKTMESLPYPR